VALVVHFIYDLIAGFSYAHFGRKFGYFIPTREDGEGSGPGLSATDPV